MQGECRGRYDYCMYLSVCTSVYMYIIWFVSVCVFICLFPSDSPLADEREFEPVSVDNEGVFCV